LFAISVPAATESPDFKEVYDLVRTHVPGLSSEELNKAAVDGLIKDLKPRVSLVGDEGQGTPAESSVAKATLLDNEVAYLRVKRVDDSLAKAVRRELDSLGATNKLTGVVLDLRYAAGDDYRSAAEVVDLFVKSGKPLLNWGDGMVRSREKMDAISVPVAVLINAETAGAAEALAAIMRSAGAGLLLGGVTSGEAAVTQEFPLKNGQRLRVATAPIQLGDGSVLSNKGVKPDIAVEVSPEDERAYYADAFKAMMSSGQTVVAGLSPTNSQSGTNRSSRRVRFNEAELVRERREGADFEAEEADGTAGQAEKPTVHDPALARALDLLKGLAVVRASRS
jgi:hypothetical protein